MSLGYAPLLIFFLVAAAAAGAGAEPPPYEPEEARAMLELLEIGSLEERIQAARWLGLKQVEEAKEPLQRLRLGLDGAKENRDLRRAAATSYELIDRPRRLRFRSAEDVRAHLDAPEGADRSDALRHLTYFGLEDELPRAVEALEDSHPEVRVQAIRVLGYFGLEDELPRLVEALKDLDPRVRAEAIRVLGQLDREAHVDLVLAFLADEDLLVRHAALAYMQVLRDPALVPSLVPVIGDPDEGLGSIAVRILEGWRLPGPVGRAILESLSREELPAARAAYLAALAELVPASLRPSDWETAVSTLMLDPAERVRLRAALLLAPEGEGSARRVLEDLLASEDSRVRRLAAEGLARSGHRPSDRIVTALLTDEDLQVRRTGLEMAAGLPPATALPLFREVLADPEADRDLLSQALYLLPEIGGREEVEILLAFGAGEEDDFLLVGTLGALGRLEEKLGTRLALDWYRELLEADGRTGVVYAAVAGAVRVAGDGSLTASLAERLRRCPDEDANQANELALTVSVLLGRSLHGPEFGRMP